MRSGGGQQSPYLDDLIGASGQAEAQGLGLFSKVSTFVTRPVLSDAGVRASPKHPRNALGLQLSPKNALSQQEPVHGTLSWQYRRAMHTPAELNALYHC